jgi:hypothetical protein
MENKELYHVGVLGMKWGRRRGDSGGGSSGSKGSGYKMRPPVVRAKIRSSVSKAKKFVESGALEKSFKEAGVTTLKRGVAVLRFGLQAYAGYKIGSAIASFAKFAIERELMKTIGK